MQTALILGVLVVLFIITWIVIACNAPTNYSMPEPLLPSGKSFWEVNEIQNLRSENIRLRSELLYVNSICENHHQPPFHRTCCCLMVHDNLAQKASAKEKELNEILKKGQKTTIQLMKDLGLKDKK